MVYILLGTGFEEMEALAPCDILRRGGVEVCLTGVNGRTVTGGHGIAVQTDCLLSEASAQSAEMVIIPGGMGGVCSLEGSEEALAFIRTVESLGGEVAAICAGPRVLAKLDLLKGHRAICYPGMENEMTGGTMLTGLKTCRDGKLTTGQGPGAALDFGLELLRVLKGEAVAEQVRSAMFYEH